jgi:hypothetical protein
MVIEDARACRHQKENTMSDSADKDTRRTCVMAAVCVVILSLVAVAAILHLACSGSGFDLVRTSSHMTWGADGYTVAIAALVLAFATLVAPRGAGDERLND